MGETTAFLLHVFVSVVLVATLYWIVNKLGISENMYPYVIFNLLIGFTLFFTTGFSNRTPDIMDVAAFNYWMIAHLMYGIVVGCFIVYTDIKKDR